MSSPLVSVVVCTYNAGDYLVPALESVLAQTHKNIEILVVDDGSSDGSVDRAMRMVSDERIRWIRQENTGKPRALNRALDELRGEFYAIQDADDLSHPTRIERLLEEFGKEEALAAVFSGHDLIVEDRRMAPKKRLKTEEQCAADIEHMRMPAHDPTAMYRVKYVEGERYDPELLLGEGLDYILRVGERHPIRVVGECLYSYRVHPNQITKQDPARREALIERVRSRARERRGLPPSASSDQGQAGRTRRDDNNLAANFIESSWDQLACGERLGAVKTGLQCVRLRPFDPQYWKSLVYASLPVFVLRSMGKIG